MSMRHSIDLNRPDIAVLTYNKNATLQLTEYGSTLDILLDRSALADLAVQTVSAMNAEMLDDFAHTLIEEFLRTDYCDVLVKSISEAYGGLERAVAV